MAKIPAGFGTGKIPNPAGRESGFYMSSSYTISMVLVRALSSRKHALHRAHIQLSIKESQNNARQASLSDTYDDEWFLSHCESENKNLFCEILSSLL